MLDKRILVNAHLHIAILTVMLRGALEQQQSSLSETSRGPREPTD